MLNVFTRTAGIAILAPAAAFASPADLPEVVQTIAAQHLPPSAVSFVVLDAQTGQVVASQNADTPRSPASTLKLITTYAALDMLGPAYTWHTRALIHGEIHDGVLDGDLILQGGGDPYMTLERWWGFARQLRTQGLRAIRGDIIVDDRAFALPALDPGAFDGRPNRVYNAVPNALMVNFQSIEFRLAPDAKLRNIGIVADPAPINLAIDNRIQFVDGRCRGAAGRVDFDVATPGWDRVVFSGRLASQCAPREFTRVLLQPAEYAYGTFVSLWRQLGGEFGGQLRVAGSPAQAQLFMNYDSLSLAEVIRLTNKYSNNVMAGHLLLTIGAERFGSPATLDKGRAAIAEWSRTRGLALQDVEIDDGAGLSRKPLVSAAALASVLNAAYHHRYAPEFLASLPLAGLDGTLRSRMPSSPAGAVRLKTGHLEGVSAVAGYVTAADGKTFVVACLVNDVRTNYGGGEPVHAALVQWVLDHL
jgi:D-alanyl-D-alanine carboxypeptidase/D-alanyl-D-alanine-endopeptidase (penicillin-binding protein 4)